MGDAERCHKLTARHRTKFSNRKMASTTEAYCEIAIAESNRRRREQSSRNVQNVMSAFQASMRAAVIEERNRRQQLNLSLISMTSLMRSVKKLVMRMTNLRMRCGEHHARPGSQTRPMCRQVQVASRKNCRKLMRLAPFRSEGVSRSLLPSFRPLQSNSGIGNVNREPALKENSNPILKNQLLRVQELLILKI